MKLGRVVQEALEEAGPAASLEIGSRHVKVRVNGRLVGVLPRGSARESKRSDLNVAAAIRRALRGHYARG